MLGSGLWVLRVWGLGGLGSRFRVLSFSHFGYEDLGKVYLVLSL